MKKEQLAEKLNGIEYGADIPKDLLQTAKDNDLVIIYAISDDLVELEGAVKEEFGAYGGTSFLLGSAGIPERPEQYEYEDEDFDNRYEKYLAKKKSAKKITAHYGGSRNSDWWFETDIPHATFKVSEDDWVQCEGLVIDLKEL